MKKIKKEWSEFQIEPSLHTTEERLAEVEALGYTIVQIENHGYFRTILAYRTTDENEEKR